jgi:hypothetical protein
LAYDNGVPEGLKVVKIDACVHEFIEWTNQLSNKGNLCKWNEKILSGL